MSNIRQTKNANDTADVKVTYGLQAEVFRDVNLIADKTSSDSINNIGNRMGTDDNPISSLLKVTSGQVFTTSFTNENKKFGPIIARVPAG